MAILIKAKLTDDYVKRYVLGCREEAYSSKRHRMQLNEDNFSMFQLEHNFSHKAPGQSKEVLSKQRNAVLQICSFFQQSLADLTDWYTIQASDGSDGAAMLIRPEEMRKILDYFLRKAKYFSHVGNSMQSALLGSLAISRIYGCMIDKPKFVVRTTGKNKSKQKNVAVEDRKTWELRFEGVRQENYYPDPHRDLYEIEENFIDLAEIRYLSEGDDAIYDKKKVSELKPWSGDDVQDEKRARETGQNVPAKFSRPRVKITEFWGDIIDEQTGECIADNMVVTIANNETIIRMDENPLWHQKRPLVAAPLLEVSNGRWGIAMMDAGTKHNRSLIELFNLMLDGAMKAIWGINQLRMDVLANPTQVTDGIPWGTNLQVTSDLPPGAKVMEPVVTGEIPQEVLAMYNILSQEENTSMMTNDLRMGAQSMRAVKATEVAAAENSLTTVFQGLSKNYESNVIQPELEMATWEITQNWDRIDKSVFEGLFPGERADQLAGLDPQDVFVNTINGMKFTVFGISQTLRKQSDFRKYTTFLQTIASSEVMLEAFLQKYDFTKLLGEIMTALDIDKTKIEGDQAKGAQNAVGGAQAGQNPTAQPGAAPGGMPNQMSQVPSAANTPQANPLTQLMQASQMNTPGPHALR